MTNISTDKSLYASRQTFNRQASASIGWAPYSWNPVTGCKHGCSYCYAARFARRGNSPLWRKYGFEPTLHVPRLDAVPPKVPAERKYCFLVSMGDLFGDWIPQYWIEDVLQATARHPDWTFLTLTKNPIRYTEIAGSIPGNVWLGASATNKTQASAAMDAFSQVRTGHVRFLSCEPLFEDVSGHLDMNHVDWLIVGAQTNPDRQPKFEHVKRLVSLASYSGTPVWLKDNLRLDNPIQERPENNRQKKLLV